MRYMIDSDVCIYAIKGVYPALNRKLAALAEGAACISVIVYGELHFGATKSATPKKMFEGIERMTEFLTVMPLDEDAAVEYGEIRTHLERKGTPIGANDLWIGAHALSLGLTLITNNEREFKRIPKLRIENWTK